MTAIDRRTFLRRTGAASGALAATGPLGAFTACAMAQQPERAVGYGPLVPRTDARGNTLLLPEAFDFVTVGPAETVGSVFYRFVPDRSPGRNGNLAEIPDVLQALKLRNEAKANMDVGHVPGQPYDVEWVDVPEPDHDDDTANHRDRQPGFTPNRVQAIDRGAAYFDREEGTWVGNGKVCFDSTSGGPVNGGQVWEYDAGRETLTLIYQSNDRAKLENPDNVVVVPKTGDIFLQEDFGGDQFIRGLTRDGRIYDFARSGDNNKARPARWARCCELRARRPSGHPGAAGPSAGAPMRAPARPRSASTNA